MADRARADAARRDPAIGAGGAAALILVLDTQVAALASLAAGAGPALAAAAWVAAATVSRVGPVLAIPLVRALARRRDRTGPPAQVPPPTPGPEIGRAGLGARFAARTPRDAPVASGTAVLVLVALVAVVP